jgi:hypothetical protein
VEIEVSIILQQHQHVESEINNKARQFLLFHLTIFISSRRASRHRVLSDALKVTFNVNDLLNFASALLDASLKRRLQCKKVTI